jgi:signal transduction histidine kinase
MRRIQACEALEYIELKRVAHEGQEWLRFIVSDRGQGVPTEYALIDFKPFFR